MDVKSYIAGFVQGLIACEMLILIIKITIDAHNTKKEMDSLSSIEELLNLNSRLNSNILNKMTEQEITIDKLTNDLQEIKNNKGE